MSEQPSIKGTIEVIQDKLTFPSGFVKQVLVVNTGGEWPQQIPVEFTKDRIALLDNLKQGDPVEVFYNLRGNEYNGKYYVNVQAWRVAGVEMPKKDEQQPPSQQPAAQPNHSQVDAGDGDDIPF